MYQLEISGPRGREILQWDPRKLHEQDPTTVATLAKAERLFQDIMAYNRRRIAAGDVATPHMALSGRWSA